jgi:hypothetical protein
MRKYHFAAAGALLLLLPFAGWASGSSTSAGTQQMMEISWMSQHTDSYAFKDMEQRFGVKVTSNGIFENDKERREIMLAAGEQPDFGNWWGAPIDHYQEGITRGIPKDWIRQYAPNIAKIYDDYPLAWLTNENPDNKDELISLNGISYTTDQNLVVPFFRYDRATEVGLQLPGYQANKISLDNVGRVYYYDYDMTWSQMETLLKGYRDNMPGTVESALGLWIGNNWNWSLGPWMGAFGLTTNGNRQHSDGKLYYWHTDPNMKAFIKAMASWWGEGLIDREAPTLERQTYWEKGAAGLYGVQSEPYSNAGQTYAGLRTPNNMVPDAELGQPGAEVVGIPPIIGPSGLRGGRAYGGTAAVGNYNFYANADVSDEKLIKTLEMLNYYFGTLEGWITFRNGQAGVHFDWDGEPYASFARNRAASEIPEGQGHGGISVYPVFYAIDRLPLILPGALSEFYTNYSLPNGGEFVKTLRFYRDDFFNETNFADVRSRKGSTLTTLFEEYFYTAITGQINVDATWGEYVRKWNQAGGADYVTELSKAPIVSALRDGRREY